MAEPKATVLYIEDDPGSQRLVQRTLQHAGYHVVVASRGIEGIDLAFQEHPDLILMDINLPDLSGREVTTHLRAAPEFRDVPIVALTAQSQAGDREKALVAGATGYLTKPIDIDRLSEQIAGFLGGKRERLAADVAQQVSAQYSQELVRRLERKIRELEKINAELRRIDKIKDDFIQLTAHELRTPLTVIHGYSQLLRSSPALEGMTAQYPEIASLVEGLTDSIDRMGTVINEIITISRFASGRVDLSLGPVALEEVIEEAVTGYAQACQERQITVICPPDGWHLRLNADGDMLRLAVENLLGNAIKYTPDGGTITLNVEIQESCVQISITDTGIGIDPEDQQRIFESFYTVGDTQLHSTSKTAFRGGGLGLGLAICKAIIEQHGGNIWVKSEGRDEARLPGSTFFVTLPKSAAAAMRSAPARSARP